ncbi:MAG: guanine deaminase [Planctomycetota bacterium]|jgi:guanine deaminase
MSQHPEERHMRQAIELALDAVRSGAGGPFGAVIVRGSEVLACGQNQVPSTNDPTAHAEMVAIRAACKKIEDFRLSGCVLYTSCEPCPMCLAAALWSRLDAVYFCGGREDAAAVGFDDSSFYAQLEKREKSRLPLQPFLHGEAQPAFDAWRDKPDKEAY